MEKIFCWAHGDGGPDLTPQNGGYGLYFLEGESQNDRLVRFDDNDSDFVTLNNLLWKLLNIEQGKYAQSTSVLDYLEAMNVSPRMIQLASAGFANTYCANIDELSLAQCIRWTKLWKNPSASAGAIDNSSDEPKSSDDLRKQSNEYRFVDSYSCLIDHLTHKNWDVSTEGPPPFTIRTNSPVSRIDSTMKDCVDSSPIHRVYLKNDETPILARTVVCTASPHVLLRPDLLSFNPPLPKEKKLALNSVKMNIAMKVILKFSRLAWPAKLQGMIFAAGDSCLLPEAWFHDTSERTQRVNATNSSTTDTAAESTPVAGYCVGFATSRFAEAIDKLPEDEVYKRFLAQLDRAFSLLSSRHMSADIHAEQQQGPLAKPSKVFIGGMIKKWTPESNPYIGGGYCSPIVGKAINYGEALARPCGPNDSIFFAGEATNALQPGGTVHRFV